MSKKKHTHIFLRVFLTILIISIGAFVFVIKQFSDPKINTTINNNPSLVQENNMVKTNGNDLLKAVNYEASFTITTNGTKRIFTSNMYHNLNKDVYISPTDTGKVQIRKAGITWSQFFETLPMSLTKECLVTGTKQTFCTNDTHVLTFTLNGKNDPNGLEKEIMNGDALNVDYSLR